MAGKAGTLALYTWLGKLGFSVHRITGQFDASGTDVLFIVDPRTPISDGEADGVVAAVAHGADLVLALSPAGRGERVSVADTPARRPRRGPRPPATPCPPSPSTPAAGCTTCPWRLARSLQPAPFLTPLLTQSGLLTAVAEQVTAGGGRAYVLASAVPLSNDGLRNADSAALVLSMLERARGGSVGFDEVHHGEASVSASGAMAVFESPLGLALLLGLAAVVAFLAISGRRLGRPLEGHDVALVPTTASYIDAMAGLYARSRDRGAVAARYADELRERLAVGGFAPAGPAGDAVFVDALRSARPELAGDVASVLQRARALAAARPDATALLTLARDVDDLERRWAQPVAAAAAQ